MSRAIAAVSPLAPVVTFAGFAARPVFSRYSYRGATAIQLVDDEGIVAMATVNLPDVDDDLAVRTADGEVAIKDWSENTGMAAALVAAGVIEAPHRYIPAGFVMAPVAFLTPLGLALAGFDPTDPGRDP